MPEIRDPILEPLWEGIRVIAHFRAGEAEGEREGMSVVLLDSEGADVTDVAPRATHELARAIMALDAILDGVLTPQATADTVGIGMVSSAHVPAGSLMLSHKPEISHGPHARAEPGAELAFVALDLLSVDGQPLLDLPLLERKRQLESLIVQSELVRVSVYTRPPLQPWLVSWKSAGFRGAIVKAANSRYRPGDETTEWAIVEREPQR